MTAPPSIRLPSDSQRLVVVGRPGSGKTQEMLHHISQRSFTEMPWIMIDFKGDDLVSALPVSAEVSIHDRPPSEPGLYVAKARIEDHDKDGPLSDYFMRIFDQGSTGCLIDEGLMVGQRNQGLRMLLTQGRSRLCPVVTGTQMPFNIDTTIFATAEFIQVFYIQHPEHQKRISQYVPPHILNFDTLRDAGLHHSVWYDVIADQGVLLRPCPEFARIADRVLTRLPVIEDPPPEMAPRRVRL